MQGFDTPSRCPTPRDTGGLLPSRVARCGASRSARSGEKASSLLTLAPLRGDFPSKVRGPDDWLLGGLPLGPLLLEEPKLGSNVVLFLFFDELDKFQYVRA